MDEEARQPPRTAAGMDLGCLGERVGIIELSPENVACESLIVGTLFQSIHLPLMICFLAI